MNYKLVDFDPRLWQEIVDKSPYSTFYHTKAWADIITRTFPKWQNATFMIEFEDGNRAIIPMLRRSLVGRIPFYWYESIAPGAYGGPIFQTPASSEHYEAINQELAKFKNIHFISNPFLDWQPIGNFNRYETFIQILRLNNDFSTIWKNYSKGRRHTVNFSKKKGVIVKEVNFLENYEQYYKVYQTQLERWGKKATDYYPSRLFLNLADSAKLTPNIKLWAAFLDGKMVSGLIVLYHKCHMVTWHGATLDAYFEFRPVDILYSTVIEDACQSGFKIFDFANSGGHESVVQYKERFGANRVPLIIYRHRNLWGLIYRTGRYIRNQLKLCPED